MHAGERRAATHGEEAMPRPASIPPWTGKQRVQRLPPAPKVNLSHAPKPRHPPYHTLSPCPPLTCSPPPARHAPPRCRCGARMPRRGAWPARGGAQVKCGGSVVQGPHPHTLLQPCSEKYSALQYIPDAAAGLVESITSPHTPTRTYPSRPNLIQKPLPAAIHIPCTPTTPPLSYPTHTHTPPSLTLPAPRVRPFSGVPGGPAASSASTAASASSASSTPRSARSSLRWVACSQGQPGVGGSWWWCVQSACCGIELVGGV